MDSVIRFNAQTTGRDKLFRLCQYSSRLIWSLLEKYRSEDDKQWVNKWKDIENHLSVSRKLLRLGRCLDSMHSALQSSHLPNSTLRVTITLSRIASSLYLFCDHVLWFNKIGLIDVNKAIWLRWSNKCWLYSITMNLVRDFYEIITLIKTYNTYGININNQKHYLSQSSSITSYSSQANNSFEALLFKIVHWIVSNKNVSVDTLKNVCDFWIPFTSLGHVQLSPSMIAILGSLSSILAIIQIFDYTYRLSPS